MNVKAIEGKTHCSFYKITPALAFPKDHNPVNTTFFFDKKDKNTKKTKKTQKDKKDKKDKKKNKDKKREKRQKRQKSHLR